MNRKIFCLIILITGLIFTSCHNDKLSNNDYESLKNSQIRFPKDMEKCSSGGAEISGKPYRLLVFRDSLVCTPCYVKSLNEWEEFMACIKPNKLDLVFVLSPKRDEYISVKAVLRHRMYNWSVYIDKSNEFWKSNPQIPEDEIFHCMLLDKQNKVVIIGNPMKNEKISKMIIQEVNK